MLYLAPVLLGDVIGSLNLLKIDNGVIIMYLVQLVEYKFLDFHDVPILCFKVWKIDVQPKKVNL